MKKRVAVALLIILNSFPLSGCGVAMLVGAIKGGNAAKRNAEVREEEAYTTYQIGMEKLNLDREKSKLEPKQILSFLEWKNQKK